MEALILEETKKLRLGDIALPEPLGPRDVRIAIKTVGICGSDIHYYQHGKIGPFVVNAPMVLGHEASGRRAGRRRGRHDAQGRGPGLHGAGIPDPNSQASRLGIYNLDPAVRFWATPPVHGVLRPTVVHPADYTFKIPDNVSFAEAAMVEPLAVGMQAAKKARIEPGDLAVVMGAGPIGMVTALAALAGGCSRVILTDTQQPKLDLGAKLGPITPVNVAKESLTEVVSQMTGGWGADVVFECSGAERALASIFEPLRPGGCVVLVGIPGGPIPLRPDCGSGERGAGGARLPLRPRLPPRLALMGGGRIDVKPLITDTFAFADSVEAFDYATHMPATSVKAQIEVG